MDRHRFVRTEMLPPQQPPNREPGRCEMAA